MPTHEPYTVSPPKPNPTFELKASGITIGTVTNYKNTILYVGEIQQRIFVPDMIEGVTAYAKTQGFAIEYVIFDADYDRFEFKLTNYA